MAIITLTILSDKLEDFRACYLEVNPVPLDDNDQPLYTDLEWFKICIIKEALRQYKLGKNRRACRELEIDEGIIT